jgi:hypothetical protein
VGTLGTPRPSHGPLQLILDISYFSLEIFICFLEVGTSLGVHLLGLWGVA